MSKEQLIQSFNDLKLQPNPSILYWDTGLGIIIAIVIIALIIHYMAKGIDHIDLQLFWLRVVLTLLIGLVGFSIIHLVGFPDEAGVKSHWKSEIFEKQYLPTQVEETFKVMQFQIFAESGITVILNTDNDKSIIEGIKKVKFVDTGHAYLKAVWVEGFEKFGIESNYYNYELFLPKEKVR